MTTQTPSHDDNATMTNQMACPLCWTPFQRVGRQRFCSPNCRKTRTHQASPQPEQPIPPQGKKRQATVYACPNCQTRYYAEQWCHDCNIPASRVGFGGLCPHCDEPVTITDLIDTPKEAQNR